MRSMSSCCWRSATAPVPRRSAREARTGARTASRVAAAVSCVGEVADRAACGVDTGRGVTADIDDVDGGCDNGAGAGAAGVEVPAEPDPDGTRKRSVTSAAAALAQSCGGAQKLTIEVVRWTMERTR